MSQTFFWDLNHPDDLYLDLVALFFYLHIDLLVLVRNLVHAKFARCNNPLEFCHIRTGHPPEIIIHKNDCRHEFSPVGIPPIRDAQDIYYFTGTCINLVRGIISVVFNGLFSTRFVDLTRICDFL